MVKVISNEEYLELKRNANYWGTIALEEKKLKNFYENLYKEEKSWHRFYKEEHGKRVSKYMVLREKYDELKKVVNNEHHCNQHCFKEHILPAIQRDYESTYEKFNFLNYWYEKLSKEYPWLKSLYIIDGKIYFK